MTTLIVELSPSVHMTIHECRCCPASTGDWPQMTLPAFWHRIAHIDGPNAICPACIAKLGRQNYIDGPNATEGDDPFDALREDYPQVEIKVITPSCIDDSPRWFTGRWRDWHRGHRCHQDDGKPRSPEGQLEIDRAHGLVPR